MTLTLPDPTFWDRPAHAKRLRARRRERERAVAEAHAWVYGPEGRAQMARELGRARRGPDGWIYECPICGPVTTCPHLSPPKR